MKVQPSTSPGPEQVRCAACGEPVRRLRLCRACHFAYCESHGRPDRHACAVVCQECAELEARPNPR